MRGTWFRVIVKTRPWIWVAAVLLAALTPNQLCAEELTEAQALQNVLAKPYDVEASYNYAEIATRNGDLKGAATALERVLLLHPEAHNIRLELGVIYYRLGAYELAARYLREALDNGTFPEFIRESAENQYRRAVAYTERSRLAGILSTGIRYDTNVTQTPLSSNILLVGTSVPATPITPHKNGLGFTGSFALNHVYSSDTSSADLETNLAGLGVAYPNNGDFDIGFASLDTGPRFNVGPLWGKDATARSFLGLSEFLYGGNQYFLAPTGGQSIRVRLTDLSAINAIVFYQHREFSNSSFRPTASLQTDDLGVGVVSYDAIIFGDNAVSASVGGVIDRAAASFYSNNSWLLGGSYSKPFTPPVLGGDLAWSAILGLRYYDSPYLAPDPVVSPETRHDRQLDLVASIAIPIRLNLAATVGFEYLRNWSNLPNFSYNDISGFANIAISF